MFTLRFFFSTLFEAHRLLVRVRRRFHSSSYCFFLYRNRSAVLGAFPQYPGIRFVVGGMRSPIESPTCPVRLPPPRLEEAPILSLSGKQERRPFSSANLSESGVAPFERRILQVFLRLFLLFFNEPPKSLRRLPALFSRIASCLFFSSLLSPRLAGLVSGHAVH